MVLKFVIFLEKKSIVLIIYNMLNRKKGERQGIDEIRVYSVHVLYLTLQSMIFTILHHL